MADPRRNGTEAYLKAGYKCTRDSARKNASKLMQTNADIKQAITARGKQAAVEAGAEPENARASAQVVGHMARIWGIASGRNPADWFERFFAGVAGLGKVAPPSRGKFGDAALDLPGQASLVPVVTAGESFAKNFGKVQTLGQPVNAGVDLEREIEPVAVEPRFTGQKPEVARKKFPRKLRKQTLDEFKDLTNQDTSWNISFSGKSFNKAKSGQYAEGDLLRVHLGAFAAFPELTRRAVLVESHPDKNGHKDIKQVHRLFAAMSLGGDVYSIRLVVKEFKSGTLGLDVESPIEDIRRLYTHEVEKKVPASISGVLASETGQPIQPLADTKKSITPWGEEGKNVPSGTKKKISADVDAGGTKSYQRAASRTVPQHPADTHLKLRHLLTGVKDHTKKACSLSGEYKTLAILTAHSLNSGAYLIRLEHDSIRSCNEVFGNLRATKWQFDMIDQFLMSLP